MRQTAQTPRRKIALVLEYDGTAYAGFQRQANAPSVQVMVEEACQSLTGASTRLKAAGRTDAGVHAMGQVVAFETDSGLSEAQYQQGLNHYLPDDIVVKQARYVPLEFDPRRQAVSRVYRYTFLCSRSRSPLRRRFVYRVGRPVDMEVMQEALVYLEGERDFAPFSGSLDLHKSTTRRLYRTEVWAEEDEVHLELEGSAFLPQQVRRITGAVLRVGLGKLTVTGFRALADSRTRGAAHWVLPSQGLCLRQVKYTVFASRRDEGKSHYNPYVDRPAEPEMAGR
jgi:tRNA pseudouridine38-40 synthase